MNYTVAEQCFQSAYNSRINRKKKKNTEGERERSVQCKLSATTLSMNYTIVPLEFIDSVTARIEG